MRHTVRRRNNRGAFQAVTGACGGKVRAPLFVPERIGRLWVWPAFPYDTASSEARVRFTEPGRTGFSSRMTEAYAGGNSIA